MLSRKKIGEAIDWLQRGAFLYTLFGGAAVTAFAKSALQNHLHFPTTGAWSVGLAVGALAAYGLSWLPQRHQGQIIPVDVAPIKAPEPPLPWAGFQSEEAWRADMAEQSRLLTLGGSVDGRLTQLQIQIIDFRKELLDFISECGQFPEPPSDRGRIRSLDWSRKYVGEISDWAEKYSAWSRRLRLGYQQRFAHRVLSLMNVVMQQQPTVNVESLEPYTHGLESGLDFTRLTEALQETVWKLDQAPPFPRVRNEVKRLIESLTGDEYLAAIRNPYLKTIVDETPPN